MRASFKEHALCKIFYLLLSSTITQLLLPVLVLVSLPAELGTATAPSAILYVNATDPICGGQTPCFSQIQATITAV